VPDQLASSSDSPLLALFRELAPRLDALFEDSSCSIWRLTRSQFASALQRSASKRFANGAFDRRSLQGYLETLHIDDLALASACMEGSEPAWESFVATYRGYLRACAGVITKNSRSGADAQELADSLFAELFGLRDGKRGQASLFRYFHGRSSLKTWLRAILAQRHIDHTRQGRRWKSIDSQDPEQSKSPPSQVVPTPSLDPHRQVYLSRFRVALTGALRALDTQERTRLELYYAQGKTLAEIGRQLGEHESSVSRHLERTRKFLRAEVEQHLREASSPMSDAQISLCFQYASEDSPIDFRELFSGKTSSKPSFGQEESS